jgi:hypothetical protein
VKILYHSLFRYTTLSFHSNGGTDEKHKNFSDERWLPGDMTKVPQTFEAGHSGS